MIIAAAIKIKIAKTIIIIITIKKTTPETTPTTPITRIIKLH